MSAPNTGVQLDPDPPGLRAAALAGGADKLADLGLRHPVLGRWRLENQKFRVFLTIL